ncbi:MAG: ribonuclease P protein component [Tenericutes bacterium]|nr:ribonuclease P protein component [Mycoplasmatota bacterium]
MKKINIVKENRDFENIINSSNYKKNQFLILYFKRNNLNYYRFGISVGKKIGNAVIRNKLKRRIRNIIDKNRKEYSNNKDYIIMVRKSCLDLPFEKLEQAFLELIKGENK